MAAAGVSIAASVFSPAATRWNSTSAAGGSFTLRPSRHFLSPSRLLSLSTEHQSSSAADTTSVKKNLAGDYGRYSHEEGSTASPLFMEETECDGLSLKNFFELAQDLVGSSGSDGGPPRWFSPLECSSQLDNSPVLLYLPGIDGTGAGLALQHKRLRKMFDIWCLHIPVMDRTSFTDLVTMVERTIRTESNRVSNRRPIYVVGESLGACIALAVAARNPNIDLVLILANPGTSFNDSPMKSLAPLLEMIPGQIQLTQPFLLSLMRGDPFKVLRTASQKGMPPVQTLAVLSDDILTASSYIPILVEILPKETLQWKLQMLKSASAYTNSRLHAIKAQILFLLSGKDQLLPSLTESSRLKRKLPDCEIRKFEENGHFLFLEDDMNLATVIKGTYFYRRGKSLDYVADYLPPTFSEFTMIYESNKVMSEVTGAVMLSTLEDGSIVRGLNGIPSEGPVLIVGYHMLLGLEVAPLVSQLLAERNIHVRGVAHPILFTKHTKETWPEASFYDVLRVMGAVPVSGPNLFRLLKNKSHVLLYPGGGREAMHKKGEQYKLFWPEQAEFVRMAVKFGAKIIPFGAVGEDDFGEVVFDIDDLMKISPLRDLILKATQENPRLRADATGEVAQQFMHMPGIMPKIPGRFYYYFGKPIDTEGWKTALRDRGKSNELYLEVKSEVERCLTYLQLKREKDPYRGIFSRLIYQTINGPQVQIPTFEL